MKQEIRIILIIYSINKLNTVCMLSLFFLFLEKKKNPGEND